MGLRLLGGLTVLCVAAAPQCRGRGCDRLGVRGRPELKRRESVDPNPPKVES
jgi:hypothetical protein